MPLMNSFTRLWRTAGLKSNLFTLETTNLKVFVNLGSEKHYPANPRPLCSANTFHNLNTRLHFVTERYIHCSHIAKEREHLPKSESAAYEGTGKTTVTILNEDVQYIMVDSISLSGFRLNNGIKGN